MTAYRVSFSSRARPRASTVSETTFTLKRHLPLSGISGELQAPADPMAGSYIYGRSSMWRLPIARGTPSTG